jgi:hypothetical protein
MVATVSVKGPTQAELEAALQRGAFAQVIQAIRIASDKSAQDAKREIRQGLAARRAGRLGNAIDANSDFKPGRKAVGIGFHRRSDGTVSASGRVFVRGRGARTLGAIRSYVEQQTTTITARNPSGLLWIPTDEIQRRVGLPNAGARNGRSNFRLEPRFWNSAGFDRKIGPLVRIRSVNGLPLLVVKDATVSAIGAPFKAKARTKTGRVRKGQREKAFIVAFIGIRSTQRTSKVDLDAVARKYQAELGPNFEAAISALEGTG